MKKIFILFFVIMIEGCSSTKFPPVFTFSLEPKDCTGATLCTLNRHPASSISAKEGSVVRLSLDSAYFAELYDKKPVEMGYSGRREVLIYAVIYKNGNFLKFSKITDIAEHMASYQPIVIQKPVFFTETVDAQYHIIIKAYEVDAKTLAHSLRRIKTTDISAIESTFYSPGTTFITGFKEVVFGFFDMVSSLTGRSVDDWSAKIAADKVFEHSIYIVPGAEEAGSEKIVLLGSGDSDFYKMAPIDKNTPLTDKGIAAYTKTKLTAIEAQSFKLEEFKSGKNSFFNGSSFIFITADRLKK